MVALSRPHVIYGCGGDTLLEFTSGIATIGDFQEAWFRDPDGNILRIHS
jgi:hypothetical protein